MVFSIQEISDYFDDDSTTIYRDEMVPSRSLLFTFIGLILSTSTLITSVHAAPFLRRHWTRDVGPHAQCMTHISAEDKVHFDHHLNQARELWAREAGNSLFARNVYKPQTNDSVDTGGQKLWEDKFVFNVTFNIIYTNETREGGYIPDKDVVAQIATLNADYSGTGISWVLINTTRTLNPTWFVDAFPGSPAEQEMKGTLGVVSPTTLNVYTMTFNKTTHSLGTASIPSKYYSDPRSDGVMIRHSTVTNGTRKNFDMGRTLTHEVGHWLGLFHPFEGGCDNGVGDNVADTPPQRSASEGCPVGRDSCEGDGPDLINNFMDYSYDACMSSFTPGQAARMLESARAFRTPSTRNTLQAPPVSNSTITATGSSPTSASPSTSTDASTTLATGPTPTVASTPGLTSAPGTGHDDPPTDEPANSDPAAAGGEDDEEREFDEEEEYF